MKIAIDSRILLWKKTGPKRYLYNLLKNLARIDKENEYYLFSFQRNPDLNSDRFEERILRSPWQPVVGRRVSDPVWNNLLLPNGLKRCEIDVFHSPYQTLPLIKVCASVVTIHDLAFELYPEDFSFGLRLYLKTFTRLASRLADKVIVPCGKVKKDITETYNVPEDKVEISHEAAEEIFRPIEHKIAKEEVARKYGVKSEFMLNVGYIRPRRNIPTLLKAFYRLKRDYSVRCKLVIVGEIAPKDTRISSLIKALALEKEIILLNNVPDEDLILFYNATELFVYPSIYEGFGLPLVEAMACGAPILASKNPPMPEILGGAGICVSPRGVEEMASFAYKILVDEHLKEELRSKSLERSKNFSWERTAKKTLEVYNAVK